MTALLRSVTEPLLEDACATLRNACVAYVGVERDVDLLRDWLGGRARICASNAVLLRDLLLRDRPDAIMIDAGEVRGGTAALVHLAAASGTTPLVISKSARRSAVKAVIDAGARYVFRETAERSIVLPCLAVACEQSRWLAARHSITPHESIAKGFALTLPALISDGSTASVRAAAAMDLALSKGVPRCELAALVSLAMGDSVDAAADRFAVSPTSVKRSRRCAYGHLALECGRDALGLLASVARTRVPLGLG